MYFSLLLGDGSLELLPSDLVILSIACKFNNFLLEALVAGRKVLILFLEILNVLLTVFFEKLPLSLFLLRLLALSL